MALTKKETSPLVVALGGNALDDIDTPQGLHKLEQLCQTLARYQDRGLLITHGNGPQIGYLDERQSDPKRPATTRQPLDVLGAETEGWLGYEIQRCLSNALQGNGEAVTVLSCMEVGASDPALLEPAKPIGGNYTECDARELSEQRGWKFRCQGGRYRRVVPSPRPLACPQIPAIASLLSDGHSVICAGGGGIPVLRDANGKLRGIDAVIDKDMASALLARELGASMLVLATNIDAVYRHWHSGKGEQAIDHASPGDLAGLDLESGSMAPKVQAACQFVELSGGTAVIGQLNELEALLECQTGTVIRPRSEITTAADSEEVLAHG